DSFVHPVAAAGCCILNLLRNLVRVLQRTADVETKNIRRIDIEQLLLHPLHVASANGIVACRKLSVETNTVPAKLTTRFDQLIDSVIEHIQTAQIGHGIEPI